MSVEKINPVYAVNSKESQDTLTAEEWNSISGAVNAAQQKINEVIDNGGTSAGGSTDSHVSMNAKGNLNIETTASDQVNSKGGKINIEPYSDLQIKPGDDISFYAHHRTGNEDEVSIKILSEASAIDSTAAEEDCPVKLQLNAAEILLTTKDKALNPKYDDDEAYVMDVTVNSDKNTRGYLKVRASAIDLRSETHGGIALQPKGKDSDDHENKIKFEHGGGDGLEFGTFNTEKTSIFTNEYRFNKDGIWKMATRTKVARETSDSKRDAADTTTHYTYQKAADDFYDNIDAEDETATTSDIIKTASALNGTNHVETHITSAGNLEIETRNTEEIIVETKETSKLDAGITPLETAIPEATAANADVNKWYVDGSNSSRLVAAESPNIKLETDSAIELVAMNACVWDDAGVTADNFAEHVSAGDFVNAAGEATGLKYDTDPATEFVDGKIYVITNDPDMKKSNVDTTEFNADYRYVKCRQVGESGGISLESDAKIKISAPKVTLEGVTGFGSSMTFGETDEGIKYQYKLTKKGNNKQCDVLQVEVYNNNTSDITFNGDNPAPTNYAEFGGTADNPIPTFCNTGVTVPAGQTVVVAQASVYDIIKLVNYMKTNAQGPWASN